MLITNNTLKEGKNKAKRKKLPKKSDNSEFVTKSAFEMHFGFPDDDCAIEEYTGGGLESVSIPKIKQSTIY